MSLRDFFAGRRVLVTGHTGFKGAWLCTWLDLLGARVYGWALEPDTNPSLFDDANVASAMEASRIGNVDDLAGMTAFFDAARPDIVFHLAAQSLVRRSYDEPVETFRTNVMGTVHCLEAARRTRSVEGVVVITSDKCYDGSPPAGGFTETSPLGGWDPYSASKGAAEIVSSAYRRSFFGPAGIGLATARGGNVVGGGDWCADRLVPDIVRAVLAERPVEIRSPDATRPWQHVLDALHGYLVLAQAVVESPHRWSRSVNFGPEHLEPHTVRELTELILREFGRGRAEYTSATDGPREADSLVLDSTTARAELGWTPSLSLRETVEWTARWYSDWATDPSGARALTVAQIERFMSRTS